MTIIIHKHLHVSCLLQLLPEVCHVIQVCVLTEGSCKHELADVESTYSGMNHCETLPGALLFSLP